MAKSCFDCANYYGSEKFPKCGALGGESCKLARASYGDCKPRGVLFEPVVKKPNIFKRLYHMVIDE